ncbi:MAG: SOS response-associated peptidase [Chloroflexota bacterium]
MCGRFTLAVDAAELEEEFKGVAFPTQFAPRYNVAPSQPVMVIPNDGKHTAALFVWGMIPSWAKDPAIGSRLINARGETLAEKPAFRGPYKYKRCLILADGFYEWKSTPGTKIKVPHYIRMADGKAFGFAGLWSEWQAADGSEVRSCAIVTTAPNGLLTMIHDRMPVILRSEDHALWLDPAPKSADELGHLIKPYPAELMRAFAVTMLVNNPANDRAECVLPA